MAFLLEADKLCKRFGGMYALKDVSLSIGQGEIHGLVGENGAGKSTLIKILTGVYRSDGGQVLVDGISADITCPADSRRLGISVIHQDRNLVPGFNGIENVYLGLPPVTGAFGHIDFKAMERTVRDVMDRYGIEVPLHVPAKKLSPPQKTLLEIVRVMMTGCRLLILDEPTASLTDKESEVLFRVISLLNGTGTSVLYISHRMEEILRLTSRISVLRGGALVATVRTQDTDIDSLIQLMSGMEPDAAAETPAPGAARASVATLSASAECRSCSPLLEVRHLATADGVVKDASFTVRRGELLGIFGLGGSGRTELLEGVYGCRGVSAGQVLHAGTPVKKLSPVYWVAHGMTLVHEDRRGHALMTGGSIKDNIVLPVLDTFVHHGIYKIKQEKKAALEKMAELHIKAQGIRQPVRELSGGNQQKVVFARALMSNPDIILCDEPTQAVDIITRQEIHRLLRSLCASGKAVVFVTSDLEEMLETADSVLVMSEGRTCGLLPNGGRTLTTEQVLRRCYHGC